MRTMSKGDDQEGDFGVWNVQPPQLCSSDFMGSDQVQELPENKTQS